MERLTTRNIAGVAVYNNPFECERCGETIWRLPDYGNGSPTDKLAAYEDAEEHNGYTVTNKKINADRIRRMTDKELAMALLCVLRNLLKSDKVCNDCTLACLQKESEGSHDGE